MQTGRVTALHRRLLWLAVLRAESLHRFGRARRRLVWRSMACYAVIPNETLAKFARRVGRGHSATALRENPKNTHLFSTRTNNMLGTGDQIWVPDEPAEPRWFKIAAGSSAKFIASGNTRIFVLIVH